MPRRRGVEHKPPADGRAGAQHDAVAASSDDRRREAELRKLPGARDARGRGRRPVVHEHTLRNREAELLELDVDSVCRGVGPRLDERVASRELAALDAGERDGHTLARFGEGDVVVVHLHAAHADVATARLDAQRVPRCDAA